VKPLESEPLNIFHILKKFELEFCIGVQCSDPPNTKISPILLLLRQTAYVCANHNLFQRTGLQKKSGNYKFFVLGWFMVSPKRVQNMGCAALLWIFSSNKSVPANRKKGIKASLYLAVQNVELFSNNQNQNKIFKILGG
jgi:hypothetical protein